MVLKFKCTYDLIYHITEAYKVNPNERNVLKDSASQFCLDGMSDDLGAHGAKNWVFRDLVAY